MNPHLLAAQAEAKELLEKHPELLRLAPANLWESILGEAWCAGARWQLQKDSHIVRAVQKMEEICQ